MFISKSCKIDTLFSFYIDRNFNHYPCVYLCVHKCVFVAHFRLIAHSIHTKLYKNTHILTHSYTRTHTPIPKHKHTYTCTVE